MPEATKLTIPTNPVLGNEKKAKLTGGGKKLGSESNGDKKRSFVDSEDAKESIVWFIIKFILTLCGCICFVIVFVDVIINKPATTSQELISDIKSLWETFSSVLTLSLGYLFGKESKKKKNRISDN